MAASVKDGGVALQFASDEMKEDRKVFIAALEQNGMALQFASDEMKEERELS